MQLNSGDKVALNKSKKASWKNEGIFEYFTEDGKWAIVRTYTSFNPNGGIKYWYPCQCDPKQIKKIDQWNDPDYYKDPTSDPMHYLERMQFLDDNYDGDCNYCDDNNCTNGECKEPIND